MLTQEYLKERLHYDPKTGIFTWLPKAVQSQYDRAWNTKYAGKQAGYIWSNKKYNTDYLYIGIDKKRHQSHRLAFLYMIGKFPDKGVDHKDRNGLNNKWINLRQADQSQNAANCAAFKNNRIGLKGVTLHPQTGRYRARIHVRGKTKHLGLYDTPEDAHIAYAIASKKYFGEFARYI